MSSLKPLLQKLADGQALREDEAGAAFEIIMSGEATPAQVGAFLMALRVRGETVEEITGAVKVMRAKARAVAAPEGAIDIVGTGGDGSGSLNISTAAAIVTAGAGAAVAKHGNRAVSSKCGAADVLAALGVNLDADYPVVEACIADVGLGFLMAPRYHSAMRHVAPVRGDLGLRTIFNILGPLSNPASVRRQFTGAFAARLVRPMAEVLRNLGLERAWVVNGSDGMDELTLTGPSLVAEVRDGVVSTFEVSPEDAGLPRATAADLAGGAPAENAEAILRLLTGEAGPFRNAVLFNAAGALIVAGKVSSLPEGVARAARAIDEGEAARVLERLVAATAPADATGAA